MSWERQSKRERMIDRLLSDSGIGAKLLAEAEADRCKRHRELAERRAAVEAKFQGEWRKCHEAVEKAEEQHKAAQKAAEEALKEYSVAAGRRSDCHDNYHRQINELDAELRACADPRIDAFIAELGAEKDASLQLVRQVPSGKKDPGTGLVLMMNNGEAVQRRIRKIMELQERAARLKTVHVENLEAEFQAIRQQIPGV